MKILVTGSTGFIGNALIKRLSSEDYDIIGLYHNKKPKNKFDNVTYLEGDITDIKSLKQVMEGIDVVFHCAAMVRDYGKRENFLKINYEGTKNLVNLSKKFSVKRFIFLSHLDYEDVKKMGYYSWSKKLAEKFLIDQNIENKFPSIIIQPGNVYGPGRAVWVLFPLMSIKKNRIALIDHGNGIFLHTYIDNLIDALLKSISSKKAIGKIIQITDGDNNIRWRDYLNSLARMTGGSDIRRNLSKKNALFISKIMDFLNKLFGIKPVLSPIAVYIFSNTKKVNIKRAKEILNYEPKVNYKDGIKHVENWLRDEGYIN
jgi:nucleoside-diphosphate-sugar epimerase